MSRQEVVVITGASAGVGRATARAFAERGACIGLLARGRAGLEAAQREVEALGGRAIAIPTDVSDAEEVERAAEQVEEEFGPIDVWINNAMVSVFSPFIEMTDDEFRRVTEVTYLGYVNGTRAALKRMLPRDHGAIVQVGSALAYRGIPLQSAYCGAKHAIQGFTDSIRTELIHDRSRVEIIEVHLPAVNTPQFTWVKSRLPKKAQPVPPVFQPEVAAEAIVWAASHAERRELHVAGSTSLVIWGNKFFPGLGDVYLAKNGVEAQQTEEPEDPRRPHNLWEPLDDAGGRDHGAHGPFDEMAKTWSTQLWLTTHRRTIVAASLAAAGAIVLAQLARRWREQPRQERASAARRGIEQRQLLPSY